MPQSPLFGFDSNSPEWADAPDCIADGLMQFAADRAAASHAMLVREAQSTLSAVVNPDALGDWVQIYQRASDDEKAALFRVMYRAVNRHCWGNPPADYCPRSARQFTRLVAHMATHDDALVLLVGLAAERNAVLETLPHIADALSQDDRAWLLFADALQQTIRRTPRNLVKISKPATLTRKGKDMAKKAADALTGHNQRYHLADYSWEAQLNALQMMRPHLVAASLIASDPPQGASQKQLLRELVADLIDALTERLGSRDDALLHLMASAGSYTMLSASVQPDRITQALFRSRIDDAPLRGLLALDALRSLAWEAQQLSIMNGQGTLTARQNSQEPENEAFTALMRYVFDRDDWTAHDTQAPTGHDLRRWADALDTTIRLYAPVLTAQRTLADSSLRRKATPRATVGGLDDLVILASILSPSIPLNDEDVFPHVKEGIIPALLEQRRAAPWVGKIVTALLLSVLETHTDYSADNGLDTYNLLVFFYPLLAGHLPEFDRWLEEEAQRGFATIAAIDDALPHGDYGSYRARGELVVVATGAETVQDTRLAAVNNWGAMALEIARSWQHVCNVARQAGRPEALHVARSVFAKVAIQQLMAGRSVLRAALEQRDADGFENAVKMFVFAYASAEDKPQPVPVATWVKQELAAAWNGVRNNTASAQTQSGGASTSQHQTEQHALLKAALVNALSSLCQAGKQRSTRHLINALRGLDTSEIPACSRGQGAE